MLRLLVFMNLALLGVRACCPDGWISFADSCYFLGRELRSWREARAHCVQEKGDLFVPNSSREWDAIREYAHLAYWSWIGLTVNSVTDAVFKPTWTQKDGTNTENMPWFNKFSLHGHAQGLDCVAYFGTPSMHLAYIHWYGCITARYYICERNGTAMNLAQELLN